MSMIHILRHADALLKDAGVGLGSQTKIMAASAGVSANVRSDFVFTDWTQSSTAKPSKQPSVVVIPTGWNAGIRDTSSVRIAFATLDIGLEVFDSDPKTVKASVAIASAALAIVLEQLPQYSQNVALPGTPTIRDVQTPLVFAYGSFPGQRTRGIPTTNGFICSVTLTEWSPNGQ